MLPACAQHFHAITTMMLIECPNIVETNARALRVDRNYYQQLRRTYKVLFLGDRYKH